MKALFLDIDGVVNSRRSSVRHGHLVGIDPTLAGRVRRVIAETGCAVVLSSTWRLWEENVAEVRAGVTSELYGMTPSIPGSRRGTEVASWLADHPEVTRYAIVDDNADFARDQPLFQTSWEIGITDEVADALIAYLNDEDAAMPAPRRRGWWRRFLGR
ncbi:HAD domain-containing protein [Gordonia sp. CPCC 205515]|uniref:HAD domain-containing protein n=1 Tax=Gordonia sp. CPCC 205515 TaxID=3140791 RepID=UPI003AF402F1